ncbi:MAG: hypothetical protein JO326_05510, partial [Acetobacteraceae bacterium]|nr:hypothetical protein [Acetobacteraceae bacterium]
LARAGLLAPFDYLSTVSGGGYIGAMVQGMVLERFQAPNRRCAGSGASPQARAVRAVQTRLGGAPDPHGQDFHNLELASLRNFSDYLSPQGGLFSDDTWAGVVLYVRNVLLNFVIYLPLLALPVTAAVAVRTLSWAFAVVPSLAVLQPICTALAGIAIAVGTYSLASMLPDHRAQTPTGEIGYAGRRAISLWTLTPALLFALAGVLALGVAPPPDSVASVCLSESQAVVACAFQPREASHMILAYLAGLSLGYAAAWLRAAWTRRGAHLFAANLMAWVVATAASTGMLWLALWLLGSTVDWNQQVQVLTVFGPFSLLAIASLHTAVFVGMRTNSDGGRLFDLDREWLARASALRLRAGFVWAVFSLACLSVSWYTQNAASIRALFAGAALSGGIAAWAGKLAPLESTLARASKLLPLAVWGPIVAALLFAILLLALLGHVVQWSFGQIQDWLLTWPLIGQSQRRWLVFVAVPLGSILIWLGLVRKLTASINSNRFSLHGVYRNRLGRAFLGSARAAQRKPDPFTNFDPADNMALADMALADAPDAPPPSRTLFPVFNCTLNLTAGGAASWSERKALPFTATPLHCGSPWLATSGAYWPTAHYAGQETPQSPLQDSNGFGVATAMTISGAALSPNWGYHSSSLTAFVMTLFNVRLGAWLPNPAAAARLGPARMNLAMPAHSLGSMLSDLLGLAGDTGGSIYLSDGGHFDNLGLYEMLRRRCRWILLVDADQDPTCSYADLGGTLRKAAIDLRARVELPQTMAIAARDDPAIATATGWAVGTIHYAATDAEPARTGTLMYLKPT